MKKDDDKNNSSSRDGQSPAANPVAPISKLPSGKSLVCVSRGRAGGVHLAWRHVGLGSGAESVGIVVVGSAVGARAPGRVGWEECRCIGGHCGIRVQSGRCEVKGRGPLAGSGAMWRVWWRGNVGAYVGVAGWESGRVRSRN